MIRCYILKDRKPVVASLLEWGAFLSSPERLVDITELPGDVVVSSVFLGIDHGWGGEPLLFETMIFGGPHDCYQERCATWDEAVAMHHRACAVARTGLVKGGG